MEAMAIQGQHFKSMGFIDGIHPRVSTLVRLMISETVTVDYDSHTERKFPISPQKHNPLSQVAADSQCSVNQP